MKTCLLAFDTSTELLAVALHAQGRERTLQMPGGAAASGALLPAIHRLLDDAGIGLGALDAIAFGRGPGAFTGLRTSCAVAQGLALGLGRPVLPIDSLLVVAEDARRQAAPQAGAFDVGVAMDARMNEAYAARYRWDAGRWQVVSPPALYTLPALAAAWTEAPRWLAGSAFAAFGERLALAPELPRLGVERDRAAALIALARAAHAAGEAVDAALALPLYLRDKVALTTREREALR